jgi:hypothetical protein
VYQADRRRRHARPNSKGVAHYPHWYRSSYKGM